MRRLAPLMAILAGCSSSLMTREEAAERDYHLALDTPDVHRSLEHVTRAIELNPRSAYFTTRGTLYQSLGQADLALEDYASALRLDPGGEATLPQRARLHLNRGLLYMRTRRLPQAEADFSESLHLAPEYIEAWLQRASLRRQLGREAEAERDLAQARRIGGEAADGFYNEGVRSVTQGDPLEAERMFRFALDLNPAHAFAHVGMARILMRREQFAEAAAHLDQAILARPQEADLYYHRGTCRMESGKPEEALEDFEKAVRLNPHPTYLAARGLAYHRVRHDDLKARADLAEAIRRDKDCYLAWFNSGVFHHEVNELDAAERDLRKAVALRASPEGTLALGRVFHDRGEFDQALALYRLGLEYYKDEAVRTALKAETERTLQAKEKSK
jgi:tetratricopeptide (TPR) repeat protein